MGFEVYLQCYRDGKPAGIPRGPVRALFPIVEEESEPNYWSVHYGPADSCKIGVTPLASNHELIESLCVYRPCGDLRMWEALLSILKMGSVILYFPGGESLLMASESAAADLPKELVESMGPRCVHSAQEILEIIHKA